MAKPLELTGVRFGNLTCLKRSENAPKGGNAYWDCECDCGKVISVNTSALKKQKSCGCHQVKRLELTGQRFGKLVALEIVGKTKGRTMIWKCKCDCGNYTEVYANKLKFGWTTSCGCLVGSHFYKPELTDEYRLIKNRNVIGEMTPATWRTAVFRRDDYTCQICHTRGDTLNAHHKDGWNWCEEKRFDTDNGVTLCVDCHNSFHDEYGRGDNTVAQYEQFKIKNKQTATV